MIVVHHLEKSRSHRILWLLEELGLDYESKEYKRDPRTRLAGPDLKAVHPLGKSPVVEDGGRKMAESGAILEYLVETRGGGKLGVPPGDPSRFDYLYWLHYAEGTAMTAILVRLYVTRVGEAVPPPLKERVESQVANQIGWMEQSLAGQDFFAGDFSAADIQMSYPVEILASRPAVADKAPNLKAWLDRIRLRPAYQRALERGGPVMW
jgi:glutathione S-transferase